VHPPRRVTDRSKCLHYGARPAFASERLTITDRGKVAHRLKRPWPDGRTHLVLDPVAFLRRLAGIIPPPRHHLVRYAGVFAPRARLRAQVVSLAPGAAARPAPARSARTAAAAQPGASTALLSGRRPTTRLPWADLLRRVFAHDVLACPCGGRRRVLCFITDATVVAAILSALGLATTVRTFAAARAPPSIAEAARQPSPDPTLDRDLGHQSPDDVGDPPFHDHLDPA
jgi:Putative transposase